MRSVSVIVLALFFSAFSASGIAAEKKAKKKSTEVTTEEPAAEQSEAPKKKRQSLHDQYAGGGYGLAGCGLGSIVFGAKPGMVQVGAATTNNYFFPQTFAISSGTSNCDIPEMGVAAASFIEINKEIVKKDAARGEGETLDSLAAIFQCDNQVQFNREIRNSYSEIFNESNDSYQSSREILKLIDSQKIENCRKS